MQLNAFGVGLRFVGVHELPGVATHPLIGYCHSLCDEGALDVADEVAWCSAWLQLPFHILSLPRSNSRMARSWLKVGRSIPLAEARVGYDVVVLWRGARNDGVTGHVGLFAGDMRLLAGNQGNAVSVAPFELRRVLGVQRIYEGV